MTTRLEGENEGLSRATKKITFLRLPEERPSFYDDLAMELL